MCGNPQRQAFFRARRNDDFEAFLPREPAFAPVAASIANAVADAIGTRVYDLPITPDKVVKALKEKAERTAREDGRK